MSYETLSLCDDGESFPILLWITKNPVYYLSHFDICVDHAFEIIPYSLPNICSQVTPGPSELLRIRSDLLPEWIKSYVDSEVNKESNIIHNYPIVGTTKFCESFGHSHDVLYNLMWLVRYFQRDDPSYRGLWIYTVKTGFSTNLHIFFKWFPELWVDHSEFENRECKIHIFPKGGVFFRLFVNDVELFHRFPLEIRQSIIQKSLTDYTPTTQNRSMFLGRRPGARGPLRLLSNVNEIMQALQNASFEIHYPEDLSLSELICLLQNTQRLIIPFGSGLTNLIYAPHSTRVLVYHHHSYFGECPPNTPISLSFFRHVVKLFPDISSVYTDTKGFLPFSEVQAWIITH